MRISLTEETAARIRDVLGTDVDLAPDVVPSVLARLAVEAPAVYSQVLGDLSGSQIRLDSEGELRRRQRRGLLRRLLFSWGEYETDVGDRVVEKRHLAAALPLALAVLTTALLGFTLVAGRRVAPAAIPYPVAALGPARDNLHPGTTKPLPSVPRLIPPGPDETFRAPRPYLVKPLGQPPLSAALPVPALPAGLSGFPDASAIIGRGPGSPIVVSLQAAAREGAKVADLARAVSPVVYNRTTELEALRRESSPGPTEPAVAGRGLGGDTPPQPAALPAGSRVLGKLVTGALVVPGAAPVPVVVEAAEPHSIWVGQAVAGPGERVQLTLTLTAPRRSEAVRAIALDPVASLPGLLGHTTIRHASAAAALATAALQATSDYAQAVARQGSVSVGGPWGPIVLGGQVPEPWTYLAARLAQDFQARGSQGGWVTTIEIPAGAPLVILIMGAS